MQEVTVINGHPGTGKTWTLINVIKHELTVNKVRPENIAFVSFTKRAIKSCLNKKELKELGIPEKDFLWFRTIHSLCYKAMGLSDKDIILPKHYREIGKLLNLPYYGGSDVTEGIPQDRNIDSFLAMDQLAKAKCMPSDECWKRYGLGLPYYEMRQFEETYYLYKKDSYLLDFTDMLYRYIDEGMPLPVEVAIIDEAMDLSLLQEEVIRKAFSNAKRIYFAGDIKQSIYDFAGADVKLFLSRQGNWINLNKSYRMPQKVWSLSNKIAGRMKDVADTRFDPKDTIGAVRTTTLFNVGDIDKSKSCMLLARNKFLLKTYTNELRKKGIFYRNRKENSIKETDSIAIKAWEELRKGKEITATDAKLVLTYIKTHVKIPENAKVVNMEYLKGLGLTENRPWYAAFRSKIKEDDILYYRHILRNGNKLSDKPNIYVDTIHSVKGDEADQVFLLTDHSKRTNNSYRYMPDTEHRVTYVALTRAMESLTIIKPQTDYYYHI